MNLSVLKQVLLERGIAPKRSKGQNFLIDGNILNLMLKHMSPQKNEFILEIGSGFGTLTKKLLELGAFVCAIELDKKLHAYLQENINNKNFQLIFGDACKQKYEDIVPETFRCLAKSSL